ncbi:MAG TPA: dihydrodipicolinate reductase C-terminal domain-containing protein, partial [Terriglobales bacterium]|nr:dihydrodipicolinate reductase C-terminal domain-containing protein [Terriglobales bacterium]
MNLLILGRGKTGSLVAEVARHRGHNITLLCAAENPHASALTVEKLRDIDIVTDFTTPQAVLGNIEACVRAGKNMVVGTTGWYGDLDKVRQLVEKSGSGFLYGANFSIGINLLFEAARTAAGILQHHYSGQIFERHHAHKKDAPSGTAVTLQKIIRDVSGKELEITSFREGDVVGMHEIVLDSPNDTI